MSIYIDQKGLTTQQRRNVVDAFHILGGSWLSSPSLTSRFDNISEKFIILRNNSYITYTSVLSSNIVIGLTEITYEQLMEKANMRDEFNMESKVTIVISLRELLRAGVIGGATNGASTGKVVYEHAIDKFGREDMIKCMSIYRAAGKEYAKAQKAIEALVFTPKPSEKDIQMKALQDQIKELQLTYNKLEKEVEYVLSYT